MFGRQRAAGVSSFALVEWANLPVGRNAAWTGPLSILVIAAAMYGFTVLGFELLQAVPVAAAGAMGH